MMNIIDERVPLLTVICTILAYLIPLTVYKINQTIHLKVDPPWKQEGNKEQNGSQKSPTNQSKRTRQR